MNEVQDLISREEWNNPRLYEAMIELDLVDEMKIIASTHNAKRIAIISSVNSLYFEVALQLITEWRMHSLASHFIEIGASEFVRLITPKSTPLVKRLAPLAARKGDTKLIKHFISLGYTNYKRMIEYAVRGKRTRLTKYLLGRCGDANLSKAFYLSYNNGMRETLFSRRIDLIEVLNIMLKNGETSLALDLIERYSIDVDDVIEVSTINNNPLTLEHALLRGGSLEHTLFCLEQCDSSIYMIDYIQGLVSLESRGVNILEIMRSFYGTDIHHRLDRIESSF